MESKRDEAQNLEGLLTPSQLAQKLGVPLSWVYGKSRLTGPGTIPRLKIGKYLRFPEAEVAAWLRNSG